jgi:Flp pilus assembly protein TadG
VAEDRKANGHREAGPREPREAGAARRFGDRGSGAIAVIIFAMLFVALAGFVVDGGMAISKRERAADLAEQAARYAAQDIDVAALRNSTQKGGTPPILLDNCQGDVRHYLQTAGVASSDVEQAGCDRTKSTAAVVYVFVQITYKPMLSGFLADRTWTAKATASATNLSGN